MAIFNSLGTLVTVTFNKKTNKANLLTSFACSLLWVDSDVQFGPNANCVWNTNQEMNIFLASGGNLIETNEIRLNHTGGLKSIDGSSESSSDTATGKRIFKNIFYISYL